MESTFREIIRYISGRSEYMVMGSFGIHCFRPFPYSDDFDVSLFSKKTIRLWAKDFRAHGWAMTRNFDTQEKQTPILTLEKDGTTLDLIYDPKIFKKYPVSRIRVGGYPIIVITPESTFLRKLSGAYLHPERGKKRSWDLRGALAIAPAVNTTKVLKLFEKVYRAKKETKPLRRRSRRR